MAQVSSLAKSGSMTCVRHDEESQSCRSELCEEAESGVGPRCVSSSLEVTLVNDGIYAM